MTWRLCRNKWVPGWEIEWDTESEPELGITWDCQWTLNA
eukprot:CAMPEP_0172320354 /NCGR_PEP_ID=MMETSP1058-20130122/40358_1 /TAXON_ID=83371 /ORGANISM="Detonula confervacea, Strain CCMP 353" /LENGTH=38 /DNA_ID= /DNA_START= /DNA_END= /DNA_ORIENTATION=